MELSTRGIINNISGFTKSKYTRKIFILIHLTRGKWTFDDTFGICVFGVLVFLFFSHHPDVKCLCLVVLTTTGHAC